MKVHEAFEAYLHTMRVAGRFSPQRVYDALEPAFAKNGFRRNQGRRNILIIRLDVMGDMILTSGIFREIRRAYPQAHITAVVRGSLLPLMEGCPHCDEVLAFDGPGFAKSTRAAIEATEIFCEKHLRGRRYDLCLLPQWGDDKRVSMLLAYMGGARERIGYSDTARNIYFRALGRDKDLEIDTSFEEAFLSRAIVNPPEILHEAARNFYLLEDAGIPVQDRATELWATAQDAEKAAETLLAAFLGQCVPVVLGIGAGGENRKYPAEKYLEAARAISGKYDAIRFILLGGEAEKRDAAFLAESLPSGVALDLTGKTTLRESMAIVSLASLYLGNVTGLMHAAAAARLPIIALYREAVDKTGIMPGLLSEYARFSPWQANAIVLRPTHALGECADTIIYGGCKEPTPHCIAQISPKDIVRAFDMLVNTRSP